MLYASLDELFPVVFLVVEADDFGDAEPFEDGDVEFGGKLEFLRIALVLGRAEGCELLRYDPIEITVFRLFVVLVFIQTEGGGIVPAEFDGPLKSFEAVQNLRPRESYSAVVARNCAQRVPKPHESLPLKRLPRLLRRPFQAANLEGAHEEGSISLLVIFFAAVMVNLRVFVLWTLKQLVE